MGAESNIKAALDKLYDEVHQANMFPFWATTTEVAHDEIRQLMASPKALPYVWRYRDQIGPLLERSAELVSMSDSERRSLILVNPGLAPRRASVTTMYTAYRLNDPNEVMPPHRHSPNAIRFGLTGHQNFTGVEGEDIVFGPGDMVLTPHDTWHNHGNKGDEPAVNLSVLDLPLVETLNAIYFEHDYKEQEGGREISRAEQTARFDPDYSKHVYGRGGLMARFVGHDRGTGAASPMYVYRWEPMREFLEAYKDHEGDPYEALKIEYIDPSNGEPVFKTMTFFAQMLRPGEKTLPLKQTASLLVSPFEGPAGHSVIDGERHDWAQFDTLAVPGGTWCQHVNDSQQPIVLFVASDEPALKKLGLFKRWGRNAQGDTLRLD
ncbi:MAG: cupin domain-containing protein [Tistlia sp.]|uniref:cupin domain-containing protein n=1 Tax=Tistlia sp. TaxID=3057121 RepID=UPI0034A25AB4